MIQAEPNPINLAQAFLEAGVFVIMLIAQVFGMAKWILGREKSHENDDALRHKSIFELIAGCKEKHEILYGEVKALETKVSNSPDRKTLDDMLERFESRVTRTIEQIEERLVNRVEHIETIQEARSKTIIDQLGEVISIVGFRKNFRRESDER